MANDGVKEPSAGISPDSEVEVLRKQIEEKQKIIDKAIFDLDHTLCVASNLAPTYRRKISEVIDHLIRKSGSKEKRSGSGGFNNRFR